MPASINGGNMKQYSKSICIEAPAEVVFKALTNPSDIRNWYHSQAQLALRTGGHFTYADLEGDVYESGEYLEVKMGELLRYRIEHHGFYKGSEVTVKVRPCQGPQNSDIDFVHSNLSEEDLKHASACWDWALSNLKSYVESGSTQTFKAWYNNNKQKYDI